jgi:hypothetical protein
MSNGEIHTEMPWWIKAITFFGVPSTIALYLVYLLASTIASSVQTNAIALIEHNSTAVILSNEIRTTQIESKITNERMMRVLRTICINGAANQGERTRCLE